MNKEKEILNYLNEIIPNPVCELNYNKDYELLLAVMLSEQTKDARVNKVTKVLFNKYDSLKKLKEANIKDIENEMSNTTFEVLDNLLFSFKTFTFPDGHGGFVITAHHLISDAWTAGLVVNEIMDYYEKIINPYLHSVT